MYQLGSTPRVLLCLLLLFLGVSPRAGEAKAMERGPASAAREQNGTAQVTAPIRLAVDATDAPRKIIHVRMTVPVVPGPLTLFYPKWIPGTHGPTGPIESMADLEMTVSGEPLAWQRDPLDPYAFQCEVPKGRRTVEVAFDYLAPPHPEPDEVSVGVTSSPQLVVMNWNALLLYPKGRPVEALLYRATLRLPSGWKSAAALPVARETPEGVEFQPVSLGTLVDSPVIAGAHFRSIPLAPQDPTPHRLDLVADSSASLEVSPAFVTGMSRVVAESGALFGTRPYRQFHFLTALSDQIPSFGLEHHECSVNSAGERGLLEDFLDKEWVPYLLPHEFLHSWCGKYRRPARMALRDFQEPQQTDLLWVYEGLTQYLGEVLEVRSGLQTTDKYREKLTRIAADLDHRPGRAWQSLADAAVSYPFALSWHGGWPASRRNANDVYSEAVLIWLEADVTIRQQSQGHRSLDDFCRRFFGGSGGAPRVEPYTFEDVVAALNAVSPQDWRTFLQTRLTATTLQAPLGGIEGSGWRLVYGDSLPENQKGLISVGPRYSLGLAVGSDGAVYDVIPGMAAARAGLAPSMKLIAVNGRRYSGDLLRTALKAAKSSSDPIELLVEQGDLYKSYRIDYHEGEKYPYLERHPVRPDLLEQILASLISRPVRASPGSGGKN